MTIALCALAYAGLMVFAGCAFIAGARADRDRRPPPDET